MAKHANLSSLFTAIADSIRAKKGTTAEIIADNFPDEIAGIETGTDTTITSNAATASDIKTGKKAWVNGSLIIGDYIPNVNFVQIGTNVKPTSAAAITFTGINKTYVNNMVGFYIATPDQSAYAINHILWLSNLRTGIVTISSIMSTNVKTFLPNTSEPEVAMVSNGSTIDMTIDVSTLTSPFNSFGESLAQKFYGFLLVPA